MKKRRVSHEHAVNSDGSRGRRWTERGTTPKTLQTWTESLSVPPRRSPTWRRQRMDWFYCREPVSAWTHGAWALLAVPASWLLWRRTRGDRGKRVGILVFGFSLIFCFAASWLF